MTKGEKLLYKLQEVFVMLSNRRDEQAEVLLQSLMDDLREIK